MSSKAVPVCGGAQGVVAGFSLSAADVCGATDHCLQYMNDALKQNGGTQIPSFVTNIPNGSETGVFLAVDLGGTNCRISAFELHGNATYSMKQAKHAVPREVMVNQRHEPLFDFIAGNIASFLAENPEMAANNISKLGTLTAASFRKLGFSFSFTYESHSVSHGTMLQWDKGWDIPDAIGRDPCRMLQDAIDRQRLHVRVAALANDSVGTLMAKAYTSSEACTPLIGAIFGTGTNAAYVEDRARIEKLPPLKELYRGEDSVMIINTEWGAWFDGTPSALPACIYDQILDRASPTSGEQLFEKRTSGLYLGELARLAIVDLLASNVLQMTLKPGSPLERPYHVSASFLSLLATSFGEPRSTNWPTIKTEISKFLSVDNISTKDAQILMQLGAAIVKRAAQLAGATIAAVIIHSERLASVLQRPKPSYSSKWREWCDWVALRTGACLGRQSYGDDNSPALDSDSRLDAAAGYIEIGIDGSLFEYYPAFEEEVRRALRIVPRIGAEGEARVKIGLAKDGSSLGAALIAQSVP
ncbi:hypothetical protein LLEC1_00047 [Akanthomyces lecanii]|uniref:Phosphotransferase n=1 Tax=Cordyceps confragosa TaxID=2714763 RepID=A0A179I3J3_CORDF|nr:hypothetical protein LLEC1_00047 [Akanthomyces lecanii]